jgi:hypothetical protein
MKRLQFFALSVPLMAALAAAFLPAEAMPPPAGPTGPAGPAPGTLGAPGPLATAAAGSTATPAPGALHGNLLPRKKGPTLPARQVDINAASATELMTLPGIGAADAARIIANRPYLSKTDLVTKNVLPTGPFISLKRHVVALQGKGQPKHASKQPHTGTTR